MKPNNAQTPKVVHQYQKPSKISAYTTFRLALTEGRGDTNFSSVTVFGKLGESIAKYVTKGREILVEGRVSVGEKGYFNIIAGQVRLGKKPEKPAKKSGKLKE